MTGQNLHPLGHPLIISIKPFTDACLIIGISLSFGVSLAPTYTYLGSGSSFIIFSAISSITFSASPSITVSTPHFFQKSIDQSHCQAAGPPITIFKPSFLAFFMGGLSIKLINDLLLTGSLFVNSHHSELGGPNAK